MVDVTTLEAIAVRLPANDTVGHPVLEPRSLESFREDHRRERMLLLREAIERGEYRVSTSEIADSILRTRRRAN